MHEERERERERKRKNLYKFKFSGKKEGGQNDKVFSNTLPF